MQVQIEKIKDVWDEVLPLIQMNYAETGIRGPEFKPEKKAYQYLQEANILHFVVARDSNGKIIAYSAVHVSMHPHFTDTIYATQDGFYVLPEHRGVFGYKFFKYIDNDLFSRGVQFITRDSCKENDWSRTLLRSGYKEIKKIYIKKLGGE